MLVTYIAVAIATVMLIKYIKQQLAYRRLFHDMPGSKDFRYTTGTFHLVPGANERGIAFLCDLARQYCYFHRGWIGPLSPAIFVYHPESIRPIIRSQAPKPRSLILSSIYDMGTPLVGEGLLTANGSKWARSRRLLTPAFHFDILKPYVDVYNICTDTLLDKLRSVSAQGESFEVFSTLSLTALDIIQRCVFSYQSNCQTTESASVYIQALVDIVRMWVERAVKPQLHCNLLYAISSEGRKLRKLCAIAHKVSDDIIEKRRKELEMDQSAPGERKVRDILDMLLTATDENGQGLTQLEMRNEVDTFLFAGHETTATGISWTLYALASNPEYQDRVYEEVMEVMGDRDNIEWEDLSKLEFTTMCIKEAMRLHGAVPFIERRITQECTIRGYTIPEGTRVFILLYTLHHNPHLWDEPEEFIPERFHPDKTRYMNPYQFIPFAAGSRNCIGQNFAMNEMKTVIAKTIRHFRLSFNPKYPVCRIPSVTIKSQTGLYLQATPRL